MSQLLLFKQMITSGNVITTASFQKWGENNQHERNANHQLRQTQVFVYPNDYQLIEQTSRALNQHH